jgi:ankyrin repeat protein
MSCLQRAYESDTGEMRHLMLDPSDDSALYPPLLTLNERLQVEEHSREIKEYYKLIGKYNQKRLHDTNLGTELDKLAQALRAGGAHAGGEELDSGVAANIGIYNFTEFWKTYPEEKKKWALEHYKDPSLEEGLGRLMRPEDVNYQDVRYCVELIESQYIGPLVSQIREEEGELRSLKEEIAQKGKEIEEAMKQDDFPINRGSKQPLVFRQIFELDKSRQREMFKYTDSKSALHYALEYEPLALPQYVDLLDKSAKEEMIKARFDNDETALIIAAGAGGKDAVDLLLKEGADIDAQGSWGSTALHSAACNGHNDVVELLLTNGAEINAKGARGNTALTFAVSLGQADVVATLLKHGADITVRNNTPAAPQGFFLYRHGLGSNALDIAIKKHPEFIAPLLLHAVTLSADVQKDFLRSVEGGIFPNILMYAAERHPLLLNDLVSELKKQSPEIIQPILSSKNIKDKTVLMKVAALGRAEAAQVLIELGAKIEDVDNKQNTALHEAANNGHANVLELLLNKAKESNQKDDLIDLPNEDGDTPLHLAVRTGGRVVNVLLEQGAALNVRNERGENVLDIARKGSNREVVKQLLLKAMTLSLDEQQDCLENIDGGIYNNVLVYAMCEHPDCVEDLMTAIGKGDQYLAGKKEMEKFFDMDAQTDIFKEKLKEMEVKARKNHSYDPAVMAAKVLIRDLMSAKADFLLTVNSENLGAVKYVLKKSCLDAAENARPVLEKHREWGKLIAAFIAVVLTLPISLPLMAFGVFSLKTNSEQKLNQFKKTVEKLDPAAKDLDPGLDEKENSKPNDSEASDSMALS